MDSESWLERVWEHREEVVYRDLFGEPQPKGIYTLKPFVFENRFGPQDLDPRWLHHGVMVYPPAQSHRGWAYVTSGLSNAWDDDQPNPYGPSGLGCEFVLELSKPQLWAIGQAQEVMAFQLLLAAGRFPTKPLLDTFDRLPLHDSIEPGGDSVLTHLMVCPGEPDLQPVQLESGTFRFLRLLGISQAEASFARERGGDELIAALAEVGAYPVTDPTRASLL